MPENEHDENIIYQTDDAATLLEFHRSGAQIRAVVGPVGSGKTSAAAWEGFYYIPTFLLSEFGIKKSRGVVVRNTYAELIDTCLDSVQNEWFTWGTWEAQRRIYRVRYPDGMEIEALFRSCDRPEDIKKFKSLQVTWYWIDEAIEVKEEIKRMLKNRIGRYPKKCPVRFGIETTNPPSVTHPMYTQFRWNRPPPGPVPKGTPLDNHAGFWQTPGENSKYLRAGYYDDLRRDYANDPDWIEMYIEGKPGIIRKGKLIYNNFVSGVHVAQQSLKWSGGTIYRGWDNTGNHPACVLVQVPSPMQNQILPSYWDERMGIVDFGNYVKAQCEMLYPGADYVDFADPAGENKFSHPSGKLTSNAQLLRDECGIDTVPSEQNFTARVQAVDQMLARRDGVFIDPDNALLIDGFMGGYHYPEIGSTGYFSDKAEKNKYSDVHDALQYVMVKLYGNLLVDTKLPELQYPENYGKGAV